MLQYTTEMNKEFWSFYRSSYSSQGKLDKQKLERFLTNLKLLHLSEKDKAMLEQPIELQDILLEVFKDSDTLPPSMHIVIIALNSQDRERTSGSRQQYPISLLPSDEKVLAKVLSSRLSKVVGIIINTDQSGFILQRFRPDDWSTFSSLCRTTSPSIALSLDAKKAFDGVEWEYLM